MPPDPIRAYRILSDLHGPFAISMVMLLLPAILITLFAQPPFRTLALAVLLALLVILAMTIILLKVIAWRTTKRAILASERMRCPQCFYDLASAEPDNTSCPECGFDMEHNKIKLFWQRYLDNPVIHTIHNPFYRR